MVYDRLADTPLRDERSTDLGERGRQALVPSSRLEDVDRLLDQARGRRRPCRHAAPAAARSLTTQPTNARVARRVRHAGVTSSSNCHGAGVVALVGARRRAPEQRPREAPVVVPARRRAAIASSCLRGRRLQIARASARPSRGRRAPAQPVPELRSRRHDVTALCSSAGASATSRTPTWIPASSNSRASAGRVDISDVERSGEPPDRLRVCSRPSTAQYQPSDAASWAPSVRVAGGEAPLEGSPHVGHLRAEARRGSAAGRVRGASLSASGTV